MTNKQTYIAGAVLLAGVAIAIGIVTLGPKTQSLPNTKNNEVVTLKNGDTYKITAGYVVKKIGGRAQTMLAYNGMIPGPTIRVAQGAEVTIEFKNETDLPALLHSHGIRMDNAFDGSQSVQEEMAPGESFSYRLKFPDAGVYWYHPHTSEVYGQPLGLYGAFVVEPSDTAYYPPVNREEVLFLSDLPVANGAITLTKDGKDQVLMGHYGNVMLVNGQEDYTLKVTAGEVVRLDVVNAANARPFNFAIPNTKLKLVGGDSGAYEKASWQDSVVLAPSERALVDVMFTQPGTYALLNKTPDKTTSLGEILVSAGTASPSYAAEFDVLQENAATQASIDPFRQYLDKAPDKKLVLSLDLSGMMAMPMPSMGGTGSTQAAAGSGAGIEWDVAQGMMQMMNTMSTTDDTKWKITDAATGKSNTDINWAFERGTPVKIEIYNDPNSAHPMQHPIHFHGQRFLVTSINGVKQTNLVWKDTVLVPTGATVEIVLDPSNPGTWMVHCHIAEHLQAGMMGTYEVK